MQKDVKIMNMSIHHVPLLHDVRHLVLHVRLWSDPIEFMVILHLPRKLLQNLTRQLNPVVVVLLELNELHQISNRLVPLLISHLHIVIIQFMHDAPIVFIIANSDDDDA